MNELDDFFSLTPDKVLDAVEESGMHTTGMIYQLNSLENRVFEVELEDQIRLVPKFYRPGRWSKEEILDEHKILQALVDHEIPACAALPFADGETLHQTSAGIHFALFPKVGGRPPDDLTDADYRELGRLIGRIHKIGESLPPPSRPALSPEVYGVDALSTILEKTEMPDGLKARYEDAVGRLVTIAKNQYSKIKPITIHADFHRGNILRTPEGWLALDFDDMTTGPESQDFWLILPGRLEDSKQEVEQLLEGYEQFREFDYGSLKLIEVLRGLRYVRYAGWIANRFQDPAFKYIFPEFGSEQYWQEQYIDLEEQLAVITEMGLS